MDNTNIKYWFNFGDVLDELYYNYTFSINVRVMILIKKVSVKDYERDKC